MLRKTLLCCIGISAQLLSASGSQVIAIDARYERSIALRADGTVVEWPSGDNCGNCEAMPASLSGVVAISGGGYYTIALKSDNTIVGWGDNVDFCLDAPTSLFGNVTAIAAGGYHAIALRKDSTIVGWCDTSSGSRKIPRTIKATGISTTFHHCAAVKTDGTVATWTGDEGPTASAITPPAGLTGVVAVAAGRYHVLALKRDSTVVAWGDNNAGQNNVPSGLKAIAIAAGEAHSLAVRTNGTVAAWGANSNGQTNVPSGLTGVIAVAGGRYHSLALKSNGGVVAWGRNNAGQCDVPSTITGVSPTPDRSRSSLRGNTANPAPGGMVEAFDLNGRLVYRTKNADGAPMSLTQLSRAGCYALRIEGERTPAMRVLAAR